MKIAVNILLAATLVAVVVQVAAGAMGRSKAAADRDRIESEAIRVRAEIQAHFETHGEYPELDREDPLMPLGSRRDDIAKLLILGKPDGYDAPDDQGPNAEFWLELTLEADPAFRIVIANSDDAPSAAGRWLDGVFVSEAGSLTKL